MHWGVKGLAGGIAGALAGALALAAMYQTAAPFELQMDREVPAFTSGFYPGERDGEVSYSWTAARAVVRLTGLDRRGPWTCRAWVRSARPADVPAPVVTLSADAVATTTTIEGSSFSEIVLAVPPRAERPGLTVAVSTVPTFAPSADDRRELGVQIDRFSCEPSSSWVWPTGQALGAAVAAVGAWGVAIGLFGFGWAPVGLALGLIAIGVASLLALGGGSFGPFPGLLTTLGTSSAVAGGLGGLVLRWRSSRGAASHTHAAGAAAVAWLVTTGFVAFELLALSHPGKPLVDAVFQAHRLDWVLSGRYFFTQPLPDGVAFPYAIGLFVTAAPLAGFINDHVLLVRLVTLAALGLAGLAVYGAVAREWRAPWPGVVALALVHLTPLVFVVVGNANLPNVFAQSVAVVAVVGCGLVWRRSGVAARAGAALVVAALVAVACLSHVSTLALLMGTMACVVVVAGAVGGRDGRRVGAWLAVATMLALVVSVTVYYRHFPEVTERFISRVTAAPASTDSRLPSTTDGGPAVLTRSLSWTEKVGNTAEQTARDVGWPLAGLALVGLWSVMRERPRDPLSLILLAWVLAWGVLVVASTLLRVDTAYQRYAAEFVGRANLAGYPAAVLLAARAMQTAWSPAGAAAVRALCILLVAVAFVQGAGLWASWFR